MNVSGLGGADQVLLNISLNQQTLSKEASELSSGLRIQSAADDPSGNAIAQGLQTKVNGLQQSVENVQEGNNLLTVADGAAANIQNILVRINSLVVESNSDINSDEQLDAIQNEINQMLLEINRISQNANFNGVHLFDGSHDTYVANPNANVTAYQINPGLLTDGTIPKGQTVSNPGNPPGFNGNLIQGAGVASIIGTNGTGGVNEIKGPGWVTGLFILEITDSSSGTSSSNVGLEQILYSNDTAFAASQGNEAIFNQDFPTNSGFQQNITEPFPTNTQDIDFSLPNILPNDVGTAMGIAIVAPQASGGGTALNINDGGDEGTTIAISLPTLNTNALNISDISVLRPTQVSDTNAVNTTTGVDSSNQYAAMDAQFFVGQALQTVAQTRAYIGSQMVATQDDSNNDNIATDNYTASESSIADLNVGTAVTQFTKNQILAQVGTSVLAQMQVSAKALNEILVGGLGLGGGFSALA